MARLARLVLPGLAHLVSWRALPGIDPYPRAADKIRLVGLLHECAAAEGVSLLAFALLREELRLLAVPGTAGALSRFVQAVGRHYVGHHNRQAQRAGTLWAGRFRSAPVQPGEWTLTALRFVDAAGEPGCTSASTRTGVVAGGAGVALEALPSAAGGAAAGAAPGAVVVHPPEYWALGNTPFERERRYRELVEDALGAEVQLKLGRCLSGGWLCADDHFAAETGRAAARQTVPRSRGRPPKSRDDLSA